MSKIIKDEYAFKLLMVPVLILILASDSACDQLVSILPDALLYKVAAIEKFSNATSFSCEARAIWSVFWLSMPFFIIMTIKYSLISCFEKPLEFKHLVGFLLLLIFVILFLLIGPSGVGNSRFTKLYRDSHIGMLIMCFSSWLGFYTIVYYFVKSLKGTFVNTHVK